MTPYASALAFDQPFDARRRLASANRITAGPMAAVWSCLISASVALGFLAFEVKILHWFLIPLTLCGCLIGTDMVKWMTNRLDLYDATGLIALLGYHFFFIAPLLMVTWEYRMKYLPDQPEDYRDWLGVMAILNLAGLLLYKGAIHYLKAAQTRKTDFCVTMADCPRSLLGSLDVFLILSCGAQASIFVAFGGVRGYIATYSQWLSGHDMFQGWALLFAVAESLPVLLTMGLAVYWRKQRTNGWMITASVLALACLILVTGGLRGSRSNVIWSLFWVLGIIHFYVKRLPRVLGPIALCLLYAFVSVYAAYKQHGGQLLDRIAVSGDYSTVSGSTEGPATVLVGDFSRCDVQAYLLYKLVSENPFIMRTAHRTWAPLP